MHHTHESQVASLGGFHIVHMVLRHYICSMYMTYFIDIKYTEVTQGSLVMMMIYVKLSQKPQGFIMLKLHGLQSKEYRIGYVYCFTHQTFSYVSILTCELAVDQHFVSHPSSDFFQKIYRHSI